MNIDEIELRRLDLTVLLVFLHLLRYRKASDVAEHMGLTQSSISHSIKRLRSSFNDPLFLRTPKGMEPTSVALGLEPRIRKAVETLSDAITVPVEFNPSSFTDVVSIGAYDNEMTTLVPGLLHAAREQAAAIRFSIRSLGRRPAFEALERQEVDIVLGFAWGRPQSIRKIELYEESYVVIMRQAHPLQLQAIDLETYLRAEHLIVSPKGDLAGIVDQELSRQGKSRRVAVSVPQFLPALDIVATSDLIATVPKRLVASHCERYQLSVLAPPVGIRSFTVSALLHERNANNPLHKWLVSVLKNSIRNGPYNDA